MASVRDPSTRAAARADDYAEQVGERPVFPTAAYVTGRASIPVSSWRTTESDVERSVAAILAATRLKCA